MPLLQSTMSIYTIIGTAEPFQSNNASLIFFDTDSITSRVYKFVDLSVAFSVVLNETLNSTLKDTD